MKRNGERPKIRRSHGTGEMSLVIQEDASPSSVEVLATNKGRKLRFLAIDLCTSISAERWSKWDGCRRTWDVVE